MTINGIPYAAYDPGRTTPYWTLVDPAVSRDVEFFNVVGPDPDFNDDNVVDGADFLIWQRGLGLTGQTSNVSGDADLSGTVDGADLAAWQEAFGAAGSAGTIAGVPEPASASLVGIALASFAVWRRRRTGR
jgi:hypothetical protein